MKKLIVLVLTVVMASSAFAVIDPDPDMMGLFADTSADTWHLDGITAFAQTEIYAVLTNPTFEELYGFEFEVTFGGSAAYTVLSSTFANPEALNVGSGTNFIVGFGSPTVTSEATLMVTMNVMYMDATTAGDIYMYLGPSEPSSNDLGLPSMLLADGVIIPVGYSTGAVDNGERIVVTSFAFAGEASPSVFPDDLDVVATEPMTFDSVKSLYR